MVTTVRRNNINHFIRRGAAGALALFPVLAAAELEIEPRIAVATTYIDNVDLVSDDLPKEEEVVGQIFPGLYLLSEGSRHRIELDYTMQALFYSEDSDRDGVDHQAAATGEFTLVDNWFFVDVDGQYTQQLIDPTRAVPTSNLFDDGNLADVTAGSIAPYLRHDFSRAQIELRYLYGRTDYSGTDTLGNELDDARNEELLARLISRGEDTLLTWRLEYNSQSADYDFSLPFKYDQLEAELGLRLTPTWRLVAIGGIESDLFTDPEEGGLEESYWMAGFRWRQDPIGEFEILAGQRFFGNAYRFSWERRARVLRMTVSYNEEPTTTAQDLALSPTEINRGVVYEPSDEFSTITAEAYLNKAFDAEITLMGRRTELGFTGFSYRREYVPSGEEENVFGGGIRLVRQTGGRSQLSLRGEYRDSEIRSNPKFTEFWASLEWQLRIQPSLVVGATLGHQNRSEQTGYEANFVTVNLEKTF